jgi:hypothetical protein
MNMEEVKIVMSVLCVIGSTGGIVSKNITGAIWPITCLFWVWM